MIPKQDRQGVRKAMDIEQKYDLNTDFSEIEKLAADAQRLASDARSKAQNAQSSVAELAESTETQFAEVNADISEIGESVAIHSENITNLDERLDTLEKSDLGGEDGATFTPSVDSSGNLSWTNDKGLANPATVNIKGDKGDKGDTGDTGDTGANGVSCTHSWNGTTLIVTSASGTSSADLKGDKGDKGDGVSFTTDDTLTLSNGTLKVNTANAVSANSTLPVTSAAVYSVLGDIESLLATI